MQNTRPNAPQELRRFHGSGSLVPSANAPRSTTKPTVPVRILVTPTPFGNASLGRFYGEMLNLVERLHRRLHSVVKNELDRRGIHAINDVQALMLFNIGDQCLTAGALRERGHYLGSNVTHNLKKLIESGFIHRETSKTDRRSILLRLTPKGEEVHAIMVDLFARHAATFEAVADVSERELDSVNARLKKVERFWTDQIRFQL